MVLRRDNSLEYKARLFFYGQMKKNCRVILFITAALVFFSGIVFLGENVDKSKKCIICVAKNEKNTNNIYVICLCDNEIIRIDLDNTSYGMKNNDEIIYTLDLRKHCCKNKNDIIVEICEQNKTIKIVNISTISTKKSSKNVCNKCIKDTCIDKSENNYIVVFVPETCTFYTKQKNNKKFKEYEIIFS